MLDVKKLITGFLILAAGASSSALILSNIGSQSAAQNVAENTVQAAPTSSDLTAAGNAFAPTDNIGIPTDYTDATTTDQDDPTNLTDSMADAFVSSIVAANPNGIQTDANGNPEITPPDNQDIATTLQNEPAFQNVTIPDWDTEVTTLQGQIKVVPYTIANVTAYITSFDNLINAQLVKTGLAAMASDGSLPTDEPTVVANGASTASNMLASAMAIPTPTPLVSFQKSFIKLMVYQRDEAQLAEGNAQDPAMMASILQAKTNDYQQAIQDFTDQEQELSSLLSVNNSPSSAQGGIFSFVDSIFSIHQAQAQGLPVIAPLTNFLESLGVATNTATQWSTYLAGVAKDMLLQIGKNVIMALIQQKVLTYIQNSGAPRFVTNWGTEVAQAGEMSAVNAINSNFTCISPTGPLSGVQVVLNAIYAPGNSTCAATFQSALSNGISPQQFYNKFSSGGFLSFGQSLQPSNNFYGSLFFAAQAANQSSQQGQSVFSLKTNASQGYRSSQVCPDGSNPNGSSPACVNNSNASDVEYPTGNSCPQGYTLQPTPNYGLCGNGAEPSVTMPGIVNTQAMDHALSGSPLVVSAANSLAGLAQFAAQDLLMGLVNQGISAATHVINGALQGDGGITSFSSSSITTAVPTSTVSTQLSCRPAIEDVELGAGQPGASFFAIGGTYDNNGNPPNYVWTSTGADGTITGTGSEFDVTYSNVGSDTVTLSDTDDNGNPIPGDSPATCVASVSVEATSTPIQVNVNVNVTTTNSGTGN